MKQTFNVSFKASSAPRGINALLLGQSVFKAGGLCILTLLFLSEGGARNATAQPYAINWYKVAGGGGVSSNANYTLISTIGQHDASPALSGNGYSLTGGFLGIFAVQTPNAPPLYIGRNGGAVSVYWQSVSGWNLQQNPNLANPAAWLLSTGVTTNNGTNYLNLLSPPGSLYFRLIKP